nr:protein LEO1 homolog isoform X2 [Tanacetum cinerariifolium]
MKPEGGDVVEGHGEAMVGSDNDGELQEVDQENLESGGPQTSYLDLTECSLLKGKNVGMKPEGGDVVEGHREAKVGSDSDDSGDQRDERDKSEGKDLGSGQIGQRVVTSRRREVVESDLERSEENQYMDNADEEIDQARSQRSPKEEKDEAHISDIAPEIRNVFGESNDEEPTDYDAAQTNVKDDTNQMGVVGVNFNARTHVKSFTGLKEATSESFKSVSSFTRKESSAVLHHTFACKNHNLSQTSSNVFQVNALLSFLEINSHALANRAYISSRNQELEKYWCETQVMAPRPRRPDNCADEFMLFMINALLFPCNFAGARLNLPVNSRGKAGIFDPAKENL